MENNSIYRTAKPWQIRVAPLYTGIGNLFMVLMMFSSYVAAGGYGIAVATAGMIATSTRIFDGITDPVIALISDGFNSKYGRVRILMGIGYLIICSSILGMFFLFPGKGVIAYTVCYMCYIVGYTFFVVASQSVPVLLTNDPVQRPKFFRWSMIYTNLITTLFTGLYLGVVLMPKYGGLTMEAFQELAVTCIVAGAVLLILSFLAITPADKPENFKVGTKEKVSIKDCWNLIKANRPMQLYILAASSDKLAQTASTQQAVNTMILGIIIGNYEFGGWMSFASLPFTVAMVIWATKQVGKTSARDGVIRWSWIAIILNLIFVAFMAISDPTRISVAVIPTLVYVVLMILRTGALTAGSACTGTMLPDIIDYELYRSGHFMPSTVAACYSFVDKVISSFSTTIVGFCLAVIGYATTMPQPGDPSTPAVFWMAMFLSCGLPVLGWICSLIAMKWYPLTKEKMIEIQQANNERRMKDAEAKSEV